MLKPAALLILLAGTLWGTQGIYINLFITAGLTPFDAAGLRILGAGLTVLSLMMIFKRRLLKVRLQDLWIFLGAGIISMAGFTCLYYSAIALTSMGTAAVLMYIAPAVVTVLARIFFKEALTPKKIAALCCALLGCVCVSGVLSTDSSQLNVPGFLSGIGCGIAYAMYSIFGTAAMHRGYAALTLVSWTFIFGAVGMLPLVNIDAVVSTLTVRPQLIVIAALFIGTATLLPYLCYSAGLKSVPAGQAAIMASVEAAAAALCGLIFFAEPLSISLCTGIGAILLSVICLNLKRRR